MEKQIYNGQCQYLNSSVSIICLWFSDICQDFVDEFAKEQNWIFLSSWRQLWAQVVAFRSSSDNYGLHFQAYKLNFGGTSLSSDQTSLM